MVTYPAHSPKRRLVLSVGTLAVLGMFFLGLGIQTASAAQTCAWGGFELGNPSKPYCAIGAYTGEIEECTPSIEGTVITVNDPSSLSCKGGGDVTCLCTGTPDPTPPVAPPTANLTVNGQERVSVYAGARLDYAWSSTNGTSFSSSYSTQQYCPGYPSGGWAADNSGGNRSDWADGGQTGCTYTITYTVTGPGGSARDSIEVQILAQPSCWWAGPINSTQWPGGASGNYGTDTTYPRPVAYAYLGLQPDGAILCRQMWDNAPQGTWFGPSANWYDRIGPLVASCTDPSWCIPTGIFRRQYECTYPDGSTARTNTCTISPEAEPVTPPLTAPAWINGNCPTPGNRTNITWETAGTNATYYAVRIGEGASGPLVFNKEDATGGSLSWNGATPGQTYRAWIHPCNASGCNWSLWVASPTFVCTATPPANYTVGLNVNPPGAGSVTGAGTYAAGSPVTITATPGAGNTFINWTEGGTAVSPWSTYTFNIAGNRTFTANFSASACTPAIKSWTVGGNTCVGTLPGTSSGANGTANDTNAPTTGTAQYRCTNGTWAASPEPGATCTTPAAPVNNPFGWLDEADCNSIRGWACDADNFGQPIDVHIYSGGPAGSGSWVGAMNASEPGDPGVAAACGGFGAHRYTFPTPATLKDGTDKAIYVHGINIGSTGSNVLLSGVPNTLNCPAPAAGTFLLSVNKIGTGSGSVAGGSNPSQTNISCGSTCSASYTPGTWVTLVPTPATGSSFTGWSGDCSGMGACLVQMSAARNVTATFTGGGSGPSVNLTQSPDTTAPGDYFTLTWSSSGVSSCSMSKVAPNGVSGVPPCYTAASDKKNDSCQPNPGMLGVHTFTFTCDGISRSVDHLVSNALPPSDPDPTGNISANPTVVGLGGVSSISWNTSNASSCEVNGPGGPWSGTSGGESTPPLNNDALYTLGCDGIALGTARVQVLPPPELRVNGGDVERAMVEQGDTIDLEWILNGASGCTLNGNSVNGDGSDDIRIDAQTTFRLVCPISGEDSVTVYVMAKGWET